MLNEVMILAVAFLGFSKGIKYLAEAIEILLQKKNDRGNGRK